MLAPGLLNWLPKLEGKLIAINDVISAVKNISGLDIPKLVKHLPENCGIKGFDEGNAVNSALLLIEECVVLILPAPGGVVNKMLMPSEKNTSASCQPPHKPWSSPGGVDMAYKFVVVVELYQPHLVLPPDIILMWLYRNGEGSKVFDIIHSRLLLLLYHGDQPQALNKEPKSGDQPSAKE